MLQFRRRRSQKSLRLAESIKVSFSSEEDSEPFSLSCRMSFARPLPVNMHTTIYRCFSTAVKDVLSRNAGFLKSLPRAAARASTEPVFIDVTEYAVISLEVEQNCLDHPTTVAEATQDAVVCPPEEDRSCDSLETSVPAADSGACCISEALETVTDAGNPNVRKSGRRLHFHPSILLWDAAEKGDIQELHRLLHCLFEKQRRGEDESSVYNHAVDFNDHTREGLTLLHLCSFLGDESLDCIRLLLRLGADVNKRDKDGWTPLNLAMSCEREQVVALLRTYQA